MNPVVAYLSGWSLVAFICLIAGIVLIIIEMFMPGFGVTGILGVISLIAALVLRADTLLNAMITLLIIIAVLCIAAIFVLRSAKKGVLSRSPIILSEAIRSGSTGLSKEAMQEMVGKEGVCLNTLRPSGNADFDGVKLDVVSAGEFIQKGSRVRIVSVEGLRILVKEI